MTQKASFLRQKLSTHDWKILSTADGSEHADVESIWIIESMKENRGFRLCLWFQKYNPDAMDGYDCVTATAANDSPPDPYSSLPKIDFLARKVEKQLEPFVESIHHLRCAGSWTDHANE